MRPDGTIHQRRKYTLHSLRKMNRKVIGKELCPDMARFFVGHATKKDEEEDYVNASYSEDDLAEAFDGIQQHLSIYNNTDKFTEAKQREQDKQIADLRNQIDELRQFIKELELHGVNFPMTNKTKGPCLNKVEAER